MKKMMICMIAVLAALVMNANEAPANTQSRDNSVSGTVEVVKANDTDYYRFYCTRGEETTVLVIGDGDTDLDLYVYDSNGNLVGYDIDLGDNCVVTWTAKRSGYFKVKVKNLGNVSNRYLLMKG